MRNLDRRSFVKFGLMVTAGAFCTITPKVWAKTYMNAGQARKAIWGDMKMSPQPVALSKDQMKAIKKASRVRVRSSHIKAWRTEGGGWFILDEVIGKHENIDMAFGLNNKGQVTGLEILEYRETYGYEVANPKWRSQFHGKDASDHLKLDKQIKNISGATLSCRHITDAINRLTHTWAIVLKNF